MSTPTTEQLKIAADELQVRGYGRVVVVPAPHKTKPEKSK